MLLVMKTFMRTSVVIVLILNMKKLKEVRSDVD